MAGRIALSLVVACALLPSTAAAKRPPPPPSASTPAPAAAREWYYLAGGRTEGPLDDASFASAYLDGRVSDTTMVWWDGAEAWVPLAKASTFAELDRWYVRHGSKGFGPLTGAALRTKLADTRSKGLSLDPLEVRMELSSWVPVASAVPLAAVPVAAQPVAAQAWEPDTGASPAVAAPVAAAAPVPAPAPTERADLPDSRADARASESSMSDEIDRANRMRKGGLITAGIGGGFVIIGGGIAGGYSTGAVGARAMWGGVALACVGIVPFIAGLAVFGAGNAKLRRATSNQRVASLRFGALASRGQSGIALRGRF